jgi:hypothetical protein
LIGAPGIHEGTSLWVYSSHSASKTSFLGRFDGEDNARRFFEFAYETNPRDTFLVFEKKRYIRAPKNSVGALEYLVNKTLITGTYTLINSNKSRLVKFDNNGTVNGLPRYLTYYVNTDFVAGGNVDEICFNLHRKDQSCFAYKIFADTLKIYEEIETKETGLRIGEIKYTLVRK